MTIVKSKKEVEYAHPVILNSYLTVGAKSALQDAYNNFIEDAIPLGAYRRVAIRYLYTEGVITSKHDAREFIDSAVRQARYLEINQDEEE